MAIHREKLPVGEITGHGADRQPSVDGSELLPNLVGGSPFVTATIAGVKVRCLVDTGSQVSTICSEFFNSYLRTKLSDPKNMLQFESSGSQRTGSTI